MENNYLKLTTILFRTFQHINEVIKLDIQSYELNYAEFGTLEVLYHKGSQPIQYVGQKMLMASSSMTYVVDKLIKKELITKIQDENDRRNTLITLSKKGESFFRKIFTEHKETLEELYKVLDEKEINQLMQLLKKIGYHAESIIDIK